VNSIRLRYVLRERDVRGQQGETVLSIYRDLGVVPKGEREDNYNKTPENLSNYKLVLPGDVVVNKMVTIQYPVTLSPRPGRVDCLRLVG
jgi:type I restriction enzyme S subunit